MIAADAIFARKLAESFAAADAAEAKAARVREEQSRMTCLALINTEAKGSGASLTVLNSSRLRGVKLFEQCNFTCNICFSSEETIESIVTLECGHYTCVDCSRGYLRSQMGDGKAGTVDCSFPSCEMLFDIQAVKLVLHDADWVRYDQQLLDRHLREDPKIRFCPKPACSVAMVHERSTSLMTCPACKHKWCFTCKTDEWHENSSCDDFQRWRQENKMGDAKFAEFMASGSASSRGKPCPNCEVPIQKNNGCNHMSCTQCRFQFLWSTLGTYKTQHRNVRNRKTNAELAAFVKKYKAECKLLQKAANKKAKKKPTKKRKRKDAVAPPAKRHK